MSALPCLLLLALAPGCFTSHVRRGFATEPDLSTIAHEPALAELDAAPVALPELVLASSAADGTAPEHGWVDVVLLAPPDAPKEVVQVPPPTRTARRGGPLGDAAAVLVTPVTFAVDVVTFPVQLAVAAWILDQPFDW